MYMKKLMKIKNINFIKDSLIKYNFRYFKSE